jgi:RNA polymerase sigma factor (sigma-70 family)
MRMDRGELGMELVRARAGQAEGLVRLLGPRLYTHARRLTGDPETARDAVQTAWIAILRGLHDLRDDAAALAWALRIVTRQVGHQRRSAGRDRRLRSDYAADPGLDPLAAPLAPGRADPDLARALAALGPDIRATVALFYLEDLSVAEVAIALDIPPGTVKSRLMTGRTRLRALLQGDENGQV